MGTVTFNTPTWPKMDWYRIRQFVWTAFLSYIAIVRLLPAFTDNVKGNESLMDFLSAAAIVVVIWNFLDKRKKP